MERPTLASYLCYGQDQIDWRGGGPTSIIIFIDLWIQTDSYRKGKKETFPELIKFDHTQGETYIVLTEKGHLVHLQYTAV